MVTFLMGLVAVGLIVVAFQLSCLFAYEESKKNEEGIAAAVEPCCPEL